MHEWSEGKYQITYRMFCENVMGESRKDAASLQFNALNIGDGVGRDAEQLLRHKIRKRIQEAGSDLRGVLSPDDLRFALMRFEVHMPDTQFRKMIEVIDSNNDGEISYNEFINYFRKHLVDTSETGIQRMVGMSLEGALSTIRQRLLNKVWALSIL
jgi:hypothetical protein